MKECKHIRHLTDNDLRDNLRLVIEGKTPWCIPPFCIREVLTNRNKQKKRRKMGTWEKNLIFLVVRYLLRWLSSNDKNKKVIPHLHADTNPLIKDADEIKYPESE